ncbi:MAG: GNAT family N-acetyltransferase, partial [Halobacteria archaeon]|nr:GNAT family N-acetyltransferase [Halobacteria archaeon]
MKVSEPVEFEHVDRQKIYDYIESHGEVKPDEVRQRLFPHDKRSFVHHIACLKRDGYIEEEDGKLRPSLDVNGETEEYDTEDFEFSIRPAKQEDIRGIIGAIRQVADEKTYIVAETVAEAIDHQDALLRHNELESRMFFVALVENEVVGWVHINAPETEKLCHTAELTMGVIEDYRDHGIGAHLFERATEWA